MAANSDFTPVIREIWPQKRVDQRFFEKSPVLANCKKSTDFAEITKHVVVHYGFSQGASHTASTVLAASQLGVNGPKFADFAVTIAEDFAAETIPDLAVERGKHNHAALVDTLDKTIEGVIDNLSARASFEIHRSGTNRRGVRGSVSSADLTLATLSDVYNFEVGMQVVAAETETGALRDSGDYVTITGINPATGVLTADGNWSGIASMADGDSLFARGDAPNNTGTILGLAGLGAWNPYGTPAALYGVTRTAHADRLAGIRYSGASDTTVQKALKRLATKMHMASRGANIGKNLKAILHPEDFDSLTIDLQSAVRYIKSESRTANVYFDGVMLQTALGSIEVLSDPYATKGYGRIINFDHLELAGLGAVPHIVQGDGLSTLRQASAFGQEFRAVWRAQLVCDAPITMGVCLLP